MMEQRERKIYIKDLMLYVLSKWKFILVGTIIYCVIAIIAKYNMDVNEYRNQNQDVHLSESMFSKSELKGIDDYIRAYDRIAYYEEYCDNSLLMNIDPKNVSKIIIQYIIDSEYTYNLSDENESDYSSVLLGAYSSYFSGGDFAVEIFEDFKNDQYLRELIFVETDAQIGNIEMIITLPTDVDASRINARINEVVAKKEAEWQEIGKHALKVVSESIVVEYDTELEIKIYDARKSMADAKASMAIIEAGLSEKQKNYIQQYYGSESIKQTIEEPTVDIKFGILGAVIGAIVTVFVFVFASILSGKLQNSDDFRVMFGVNVLGVVDIKKDEETLSKAINYINSKIKIICEQNNIDNIYITSSVEEQTNVKDLENIYHSLMELNKNIVIGKNICKDSMALEQVKKANNVIFVEIVRRSLYDDIAEQLQITTEYKINNLGVIVIK